MAYKSIFKPKNPRKYIGANIHKIVCRSTWEVGLAKYCDTNSTVKAWSLESVIIPYIDKLCIKQRKYYMDFYIEMQTGNKLLIEVKPHNQTYAPGGFKKKYLEIQGLLNESPNLIHDPRVQKKYGQVIQFAKNRDKWNTANKFANDHNMTFQIWTEHTLRKLGIKIVSSFKKSKKLKPLTRQK